MPSAEIPRDVLSDDDGVLSGKDGRSQDVGENLVSTAATTATDSAVAPPTVGALPCTRDGANRSEELSLAGAAPTAEEDEAGCGDGGSSAALLARNGGATFVLVAREHLVGTWLAVFVRASLLQEVSDVRTGAEIRPSAENV